MPAVATYQGPEVGASDGQTAVYVWYNGSCSGRKCSDDDREGCSLLQFL